MSETRNAIFLGVAVGAIGATLFLTPFGRVFEERIGLGWLFAVRGPVEPPPEVMIVSVDGRAAARLRATAPGPDWSGCPASVQRPGAPAWTRCMQVRIIDSLTRKGASVIVYDIAFVGSTTPEEDAELVAAVERSQRVVLLQPMTQNKVPGSNVFTESLTGPFPPLPSVALGLGPFPLPKVPARVSQFWAFKTQFGDVPTLPVVALQAYALPLMRRSAKAAEWGGARLLDHIGVSLDEVTNGEDLGRLMRLLRQTLKDSPEWSAQLATLPLGLESGGAEAQPASLLRSLARAYSGEDNHFINFYGPAGTIHTVPADVVLRSKPGEDSRVSGKVVFVGASDNSNPEQSDGYYTVFTGEDGIDLSGVEIAASAFANLLTDTTLKHLSNLEVAAILLVTGTILGISAAVLQTLIAMPLSVAFAGLYFGAVQLTFGTHHLWMPLALPLLVQLPLALLLGLGRQYMVQKWARENVSQALRYYVPGHVADKFSDKVEPTESGELVYGTCLATDVENYTVLSERLEPEDLRALMNEYYEEITKPVTGHDGIITDVMADSLMCVWLSPQTDCENRLSACRAALGIRRSVERFNGRHRQRQLPTRIGLHAGWLSVGNIGGGGHYAYSLVGDIANTTSRIESLNRHLGTWILASEDVVSGVGGLILRRLGMFRLKGKSESVSIFEIMGESLEPDTGHSELLGGFASALQAYEEGLWQKAGWKFEEILVAYPDDGPSRFYVARCSQLVKIAPDIDARIICMDQK